MTVTKFALAALPLLLTTTSVLAQEAASDYFVLSLNGGAVYYNLPDVATGAIVNGEAETVESTVIGGTVGLGAAAGIGQWGDFDASIGFNGFLTYGNISGSSAVKTYDEPGVVVIPGFTTPDGFIGIDTNPSGGDDVSSDVLVSFEGSNAGGYSGSVNGDDAATDAGQYEPTPSGFIFAARTTSADPDGPDPGGGPADIGSAGYGFIASPTGGIFVASGDISGLEISTETSGTFAYAGADITLGLGKATDETTQVQGFFGPSYRYMAQGSETSISIDIPEAAAPYDGLTVYPTLSIDREQDITTHYLGGVAGFTLSHLLSDTLTLTLGAEGNIYYANSTLSGSDTYSIEGGSGVAGIPVDGDSVTAQSGSIEDSGMAFGAKGQAGLSFAVSDTMQIGFGGSVEYLSRVAVASPGSADDILSTNTYAPGSYEGEAVYDSPASTAASLTFGDMWGFGLTASLTGQF